jgi:hypothetical protein
MLPDRSERKRFRFHGQDGQVQGRNMDGRKTNGQGTAVGEGKGMDAGWGAGPPLVTVHNYLPHRNTGKARDGNCQGAKGTQYICGIWNYRQHKQKRQTIFSLKGKWPLLPEHKNLHNIVCMPPKKGVKQHGHGRREKFNGAEKGSLCKRSWVVRTHKVSERNL